MHPQTNESQQTRCCGEPDPDGLEPVGHRLTINSRQDGSPRARLHFSFAPDLPDADRREVIELIADAIRTA